MTIQGEIMDTILSVNPNATPQSINSFVSIIYTITISYIYLAILTYIFNSSITIANIIVFFIFFVLLEYNTNKLYIKIRQYGDPTLTHSRLNEEYVEVYKCIKSYIYAMKDKPMQMYKYCIS